MPRWMHSPIPGHLLQLALPAGAAAGRRRHRGRSDRGSGVQTNYSLFACSPQVLPLGAGATVGAHLLCFLSISTRAGADTGCGRHSGSSDLGAAPSYHLKSTTPPPGCLLPQVLPLGAGATVAAQTEEEVELAPYAAGARPAKLPMGGCLLLRNTLNGRARTVVSITSQFGRVLCELGAPSSPQLGSSPAPACQQHLSPQCCCAGLWGRGVGSQGG